MSPYAAPSSMASGPADSNAWPACDLLPAGYGEVTLDGQRDPPERNRSHEIHDSGPFSLGPMSVCLVRLGGDGGDMNENRGPVLACIDGSDDSDRAIRYALEEAGRLGTTVRLLHVVPELVAYAPVPTTFPCRASTRRRRRS